MDFQNLIELYRSNGNQNNAKQMDDYLKNQYRHLGIKTPKRREIMKSFLRKQAVQKEWIPMLWALPEREFQCVAIDMLGKIKKQLMPEDVPMVERLITQKPWWDTVDSLSVQIVGHLFKAFPETREIYIKKWIESDNIWLNRTAILHQLHYKKATDEVILYECVLKHAESKEFFIQKSIGWALRMYAKTNPESVIDFVESHQLKPLSKREALKRVGGK